MEIQRESTLAALARNGQNDNQRAARLAMEKVLNWPESVEKGPWTPVL